MNVLDIQKDLRKLANPQKAKNLQRFFKTGKGEYGEGDKFLGITVPEIRRTIKSYNHLSLVEITILLHSPFHEERLAGLLILVDQFKKADTISRKSIVNFYLTNTKFINNWDLVDLTAPNIVGWHLFEKDRSILYKLAKSKSLWERRIAVMSTFYFIRNNQFADAIKISQILLTDKHDLIHKAVGWMLREIGKRDLKTEENFLKKHYHHMPRVMLRYAIEKFPPAKKSDYLK